MFNALLRNFETIGEKFLQSLHPGFPTGVENMGGSSKFDGEGLSQYMGAACGEDENFVEKYL